MIVSSTPRGGGKYWANIPTVSRTVYSGSSSLSCSTKPIRPRQARVGEAGSWPRTDTAPAVRGR